MRTKKTKHGVDISQTLGMRAPEPKPTWIVALNRTHARLYEKAGKHSSLRLLQDLPFPEGRAKSSELVGDRPGRSFDSWSHSSAQAVSARHGYSETDPAEHELNRLVVRVAGWLEQGHATNQFTDLVLVAEPHALGRLKSKLSDGVIRSVSHQHEKDFSWVTERDLEARLEEFL